MKTSQVAKRLLVGVVFTTLSLQLCRSAPICGGVAPFSQNPQLAANFDTFLGVGVHLGGTQGPYGNATAVIQDLSYVGARHVRDSAGGLLSGSNINGQWDPRAYDKLAAFNQAGIRFDIIMGPNMAGDLPKLEPYAQSIESLEGPNEPEYTKYNYKGLVGTPAAEQIQKDLYGAAKNDPALGGLPVLNIAFARASSTTNEGQLANYADFNNVHSYFTHGQSPRLKLDADLRGTVDTPGKPYIVTETGYPSDAPGGPNGQFNAGGHNMVDEDVQAKYLLDDVFDAFDLHVQRVYVYELFDEKPEPQDTDQEQHFGLFRADGSPKPAAVALHNAMTILHGDPDAAPVPFPYSIQASPASGLTCNLYSLLLTRKTGVYDIVVWPEPTLWGADYKRAPQPAASNVDINFPIPQGSVRVFDPLLGTQAQSEYHGVSHLSLSLVDHPLIIETRGF